MRIKILEPFWENLFPYQIIGILSVQDFNDDGLDEILLEDSQNNYHILQYQFNTFIELDYTEFKDLSDIQKSIEINEISKTGVWSDDEGKYKFCFDQDKRYAIFEEKSMVLEKFPHSWVSNKSLPSRPLREYNVHTIVNCKFFDIANDGRKDLLILTILNTPYKLSMHTLTGTIIWFYRYFINDEGPDGYWKKSEGDKWGINSVISLVQTIDISEFRNISDIRDFYFYDIDKDGSKEFIYITKDEALKISKTELSGINAKIIVPNIVFASDVFPIIIKMKNLNQEKDYESISTNKDRFHDNLVFEETRKDFPLEELPKGTEKVIELHYKALNTTQKPIDIKIPPIELNYLGGEEETEKIDGFSIKIYPFGSEEVIKIFSQYFYNPKVKEHLKVPIKKKTLVDEINNYLSKISKDFILSEEMFFRYLEFLSSCKILQFSKDNNKILISISPSEAIKSLEETHKKPVLPAKKPAPPAKKPTPKKMVPTPSPTKKLAPKIAPPPPVEEMLSAKESEGLEGVSGEIEEEQEIIQYKKDVPPPDRKDVYKIKTYIERKFKDYINIDEIKISDISKDLKMNKEELVALLKKYLTRKSFFKNTSWNIILHHSKIIKVNR